MELQYAGLVVTKMSYKDIAGLTTMGMSLTVAANAFPKKKKKKSLVKTGMESIVGLSFVKANANLVGSL